MTTEQKIVADNIVTFFKDANGVRQHISNISTMGDTAMIKNNFVYALNILEEKNIVKCADGHNRQIFYLLPDGWDYTSFDDLLKKEKASKEKKSWKEEIDLSNAESVYKTYGMTRFITWVTFAIAVILALLKLAEALKLWPYHK